MYRFRDSEYKVPEKTFKLLLIGDDTCGKSCILQRYSEDIFIPSYLSTIGVDFKSKYLLCDEKCIKLQIWDTAGQERFRAITSKYYRGINGIFIVYDISNKKSFLNIDKWIDEAKKNTSEDIVMILIGNKSDMNNREVSIVDGLKMAEKYNIPFLETSAKENININKSFEIIVTQLIKNNINNNDNDNKIITINNDTFIKRWCNIL
jgi:small GTP-binding protein